MPLTVSLNVVDQHGCEGFVYGDSITKGPLFTRDYRAVYERGGANGKTPVVLIVQGRSELAVELLSLRVVGVERFDPPKNISRISTCDQPESAAEPPRDFLLDLDAANPKLLSNGSRTFPFTVSSTDPEYFRIEPQALRNLCAWQLELIWSSGGRTGRMLVDRDFLKIRTYTG
jgi:hypothetical protein